MCNTLTHTHTRYILLNYNILICTYTTIRRQCRRHCYSHTVLYILLLYKKLIYRACIHITHTHKTRVSQTLHSARLKPCRARVLQQCAPCPILSGYFSFTPFLVTGSKRVQNLQSRSNHPIFSHRNPVFVFFLPLSGCDVLQRRLCTLHTLRRNTRIIKSSLGL